MNQTFGHSILLFFLLNCSALEEIRKAWLTKSAFYHRGRNIRLLLILNFRLSQSMLSMSQRQFVVLMMFQFVFFEGKFWFQRHVANLAGPVGGVVSLIFVLSSSLLKTFLFCHWWRGRISSSIYHGQDFSGLANMWGELRSLSTE